MPMVSSKSPWSEFIDGKYILDTTKMYFDTYLYRAKFFVYGMSFSPYIRERTEEQFVNWMLQFNNPKSDWSFPRGHINKVVKEDAIHIFSLTKLINKLKSPSLRVRIEGNSLCIYTVTADEMLRFFNAAPQKLMDRIEEINRPASKAAIKKLSQQVIFQPNPTHKFKLLIRERRYNVDEMKAILTFVNNHPDNEIKVTPLMKQRLSANFDNHISGFIYSSDEKLTFMLQMIAPKLIKKVLVIEQQ